MITSGVRAFLLLLFAPYVSAMTFYLPLNIEDRNLGEIPVSISGTDINAVSLPILKSLLGARVAESIWQNLSENIAADNMILFSKLAEKGVNIIYDPATLSLSAKISPEAFGEYYVNFDKDFPPFIASESGNFSGLNSINFSHTERWKSQSTEQFSSVDWLAQANIGGAAGVNINLANYLESNDSDVSVLRGEWTAFYDKPNVPFRLSVGDVSLGSGSGSAGHISGGNFGGLSFSSDYAALQPNRIIGPNNNQELILNESAEIDISVNGFIIYSGRQEAGRFNLANLPMTNGANDIIVDITYLSGQTERRVFTQFHNNRLLQEGLFNYSVTAGAPSMYNIDKGIEYQDSWAVAGYAHYGIASWLTLGGNAAAAKYGNVLGVTATLGTNWGNISSQFSISDANKNANRDYYTDNTNGDGYGNIISISFESTVWGASESQSPNLRLSAESANSFSSTPWQKNTFEQSHNRYLVNYMWAFNEQLSATLSGSYTQDHEQNEQTNGSLLFNWTHNNFSFGFGANFADSSTYYESADDGEMQYFLTFDWSWTHTKHGFDIGANYNSNDNHSRLELNRTGNGSVGSVGYRAQVEYDDNRERQSARLDYTASRMRLEMEVARNNKRTNDAGVNYSASIRGNSAIGFVDGKFGWGRAQKGPFMIAHAHPTLYEQEVLLGTNQQGDYKALATSNMGGLLPLNVPYTINNFDINVPDAPVGYDWGESRFTVSPGAATGHFIMVGTDNSYTARGILLDANNEPISYLQGVIIGDDSRQSFFTNQFGLFYIQGVGPGQYNIEVSTETYKPLSILIEQTKDHLIELGTLNMECIKEDCYVYP